MSERIEQREYILKPAIHKHESFILRKGWLHKGIRNIEREPRLFSRSDINPCDILGIGANMVKSLRYWLKATQMVTDSNGVQKTTEYCDIINRNDPYFEERGTNYIIHYLLASNKENATAWWWFFNEYKGQTVDKTQFIEDLAEFCHIHGEGEPPAQKVLESEFSALMRTYYGKGEAEDDPEETKICPLTELRLVTLAKQKGGEKTYKKAMPDKDDIHPLIAYAVISEKQAKLDTDEIQIGELLNGENNIGKVFNLDRSTIFYLIEKIERLGLIKITRTAGLDVIKVKTKMTLADCLKAYYKTLDGEGQDD